MEPCHEFDIKRAMQHLYMALACIHYQYDHWWSWWWSLAIFASPANHIITLVPITIIMIQSPKQIADQWTLSVGWDPFRITFWLLAPSPSHSQHHNHIQTWNKTVHIPSPQSRLCGGIFNLFPLFTSLLSPLAPVSIIYLSRIHIFMPPRLKTMPQMCTFLVFSSHFIVIAVLIDYYIFALLLLELLK